MGECLYIGTNIGGYNEHITRGTGQRSPPQICMWVRFLRAPGSEDASGMEMVRVKEKGGKVGKPKRYLILTCLNIFVFCLRFPDFF